MSANPTCHDFDLDPLEPDNILLELIKHGGLPFKTRIFYRSGKSSFRSEGCEYSHHLQEKNRSIFGKYYGISFLPITGKILLNHLLTLSEDILLKIQCGFRLKRRNINMIFFEKEIQKKCKEQQKPLQKKYLSVF